ncbi:MAG: tRNA (adenosine(37)-N6)-dimethylallyltransferase MiaA [Candidatus Vogelbacteria bacterium]|nr:tRNA (adenosine(37)-N6)-dimethylallyltransferase MiaA [Candidatus Vogelbacteria bacterium]
MQSKKLKILVVLGPTATGKSDLAVRLAKKFDGEIISADSRQVYKSMSIGTGKITNKEKNGIKHHLLDVASPKKIFTVAEYKILTEQAIHKITSKNKTPIICGGTGFYIQSIVDDLQIPEVPANFVLRQQLESKSLGELNTKLIKLDPIRAKNIDSKNNVRLVRAIEIAIALGKVPKIKKGFNKKYEFLQIGLTLNNKKLEEKINKRLSKRIRAGMIAEVKKIHKSGISWRKLESFGLEYKFVAKYLQDKITKGDMIRLLEIAIRQYAKRQVTWFKRDKTIKWFDPKDYKKIAAQVQSFI